MPITMGERPFFTYLILAFIGFANALPLPLTGTTLSLRLTEAGFSKEAIGLFALLAIPFSFKLLWSPLIDRVPPPFFQSSPRKGWILTALLGMSAALTGMGYFAPEEHLASFALCTFALSIFTGCLYMAGLSYELESIDDKDYRQGSAWVHAGYRVGLLFAGATALYIALLFDWEAMYYGMALTLAAGAIPILMTPEPYRSAQVLALKKQSPNSLFQEVLIAPCKNFFSRADWPLLIALLLAVKLGDQLSKTMEGPFYLSLGFNKADLALASKLWGFGATLLGALGAGYFLKSRSPLQTALITGMIHTLTIGLNALFAFTGKSYLLLYTTAALENLTGGLAMSSFIFYLWSLCDKRYVKVQYALLWSLFSLKGSLIACAGAQIAAHTSWPLFFTLASLLGAGSLATLFLFTQEKVTDPLAQKH